MGKSFGRILDGFNGGDGGLSYSTYVHSHWKLNEGTGNAINAKNASFNLSEVGTVPATTGKLGGCRGTFSNSNYFTGPSGDTVYDGSVFLVEGWINISAPGATKTIVGKSNGVNAGWQVEVNGSNKLVFIVNASALTSTADAVGGWIYFACGQRASSGTNEWRMYINATIDQQGTANTLSKATGETLQLGINYAKNQGFTGLIDSVAYWNTMPTTWAEVEAILTARYAGGVGKEYSFDP